MRIVTRSGMVHVLLEDSKSTSLTQTKAAEPTRKVYFKPATKGLAQAKAAEMDVAKANREKALHFLNKNFPPQAPKNQFSTSVWSTGHKQSHANLFTLKGPFSAEAPKSSSSSTAPKSTNQYNPSNIG